MHRRTLVSLWPAGALTMTLAAGLIVSATGAAPVLKTLAFRDDFESGSLETWHMPFPEDWQILSEGGNHYLHMKRSREPGVPRRPLQFARLKDVRVGSFELRARVRREGRSMILVFNYVDTMHFYYVHLSGDRGADQPVHNGVFIVNGEPRTRIAGTEAPPALPDAAWHEVRVARDVPAESIEVFVDGQTQPLFRVMDRRFTCGEIGLGSFDETGDFEDVRLTSSDADCVPGAILRQASSS